MSFIKNLFRKNKPKSKFRLVKETGAGGETSYSTERYQGSLVGWIFVSDSFCYDEAEAKRRFDLIASGKKLGKKEIVEEV